MTFPALDRIEALARNLDGWQRQLADRMAELEQTSAEGVSDSGLVRGHRRGRRQDRFY